MNPIGPRSCYDEGKRAAESILFDYYRTYNLDIRVVRIFNTYGPFLSLSDLGVRGAIFAHITFSTSMSVCAERSLHFITDSAAFAFISFNY